MHASLQLQEVEQKEIMNNEACVHATTPTEACAHVCGACIDGVVARVSARKRCARAQGEQAL